MRVAYIGNFGPEHSTENHIAKTLRSLGIEVTQYQENDWTTDAIYSDIAANTGDPDLLLWTRTWGMRGNAELLLNQLAQRGIPTVSFHLDLYFGIARGNDIDTDPFWKTKYVFTPDGGHNQEFKDHGINHYYLRPGVYEPECNFGKPSREFSYSVAFVGSEQYHPEWPYRPQLVNWLRNNYGFEFGKFGYPERTMRNADLNDLYASARVVVGDSLCVGFNHPNYWSDRVYETLGRGGFIIHPYIQGMEKEFTDGENIVFYKFGDFEDLRSKIDYYLAHPYERESIRRAGHLFVKFNATYTDRMREMLSTLADKEPQLKPKLKGVLDREYQTT